MCETKCVGNGECVFVFCVLNAKIGLKLNLSSGAASLRRLIRHKGENDVLKPCLNIQH